MSNVTQKIANSALTDMSVEDLLMLTSDNINLVTARQIMPDGFYNFELKSQEIAEVGKEKTKAIKCVLVLTGCVELTNKADQQILDAIDLASNPQELEATFSLQSADGYGFRNYMTFTQGAAEKIGALTGADRMEKLNGFLGVVHITTNTFLPNGSVDSPENYKQSNRIQATETIWS